MISRFKLPCTAHFELFVFMKVLSCKIYCNYRSESPMILTLLTNRAPSDDAINAAEAIQASGARIIVISKSIQPSNELLSIASNPKKVNPIEQGLGNQLEFLIFVVS